MQITDKSSFRMTSFVEHYHFANDADEKSIRCLFPNGKPFPIGATGKLETL
jgi:hypothetical protein